MQVQKTLHSPAKINLRLEITGRRPDGYHCVTMINARISLADLIHLQLSNHEEAVSVAVRGTSADCSMAALTDPEQNLASRAASLVFEIIGRSFKTHIVVEKNIPIGGGLGGGSANAATVLRALPAALVELGCISQGACVQLEEELGRRVVELGADVPYFYHANSAFSLVSGIGETIEGLPVVLGDDLPILLVLPSVAVSTPAVFSQYLADATPFSMPSPDLLRDSLPTSSENDIDLYPLLASLLKNDLWQPAKALFPEVEAVSSCLSAMVGGRFAMSGSGSTFFILPKNQQEDIAVLEETLKTRLEPMGVKILRTSLLANFFQ